jgi:GT2 family glycosyltransferase
VVRSLARQLVASLPGGRRLVRKRDHLLRIRSILASGLMDVEWYSVQAGREFTTPRAAVHDYLISGRLAGLSPNILFCPEWIVGRQSRTTPKDPLIRYLAGDIHKPTHPLFDLESYRAAVPQSLGHRGGPLGYFLENATESTVVPVTEQVGGTHVWKEVEARLWAAARRHAADKANDLSHQDTTWDAAAERRLRAELTRTPRRGTDPLVSVVMPVHDRSTTVRQAIESVQRQTHRNWELIVVDDGSIDDSADVVESFAAADDRITLIRLPKSGVSAARNAALSAATGEYVSFLDSDNTWVPDFLFLMVTWMKTKNVEIAHSAIEGHQESRVWFRGGDGGSDQMMIDNFIDLNALVVTKSVLNQAGRFDTDIRRMVDWDLLIRLTRVERPSFVPFIGVIYDDERSSGTRITTRESPGWRERVLSKYLIDWEAERSRSRVESRVSVVIPTYDDWQMTLRAVQSVLENAGGHDVEVVVLDNGSSSFVLQMLMAVVEPLPSVVLVRQPKNVQFALGSNLGFVASSGATTVFLNNDAEARPGWLTPLLEPLSDPQVAGVQPLLLYPDGTVQCAGVVFPVRPGLPVHFLVDHPAEDATSLGVITTHAVTAAAVAMRAETVSRMEGFDPIFQNGWEDIDLCLRAGGADGRVFRVATASVVMHHESKTRKGRSVSQNRHIFLDRWRGRLPHGEDPVWELAGLMVERYRPEDVRGNADLIGIPRPVVLRRHRQHSRSPVLRWAIKTAAPAGPVGDGWGDTHFAAALARALRRLGQEVVIDRLEAHDRPTSELDDVVLNLRGLKDTAIQPGRINLMWLISHPDLVTVRELQRYDAVFASSLSWARDHAKLLDIPVRPLLQATDVSLFHPDLATPDSGPAAVFVGSSRGIFRPVVRDAIAADLDLVVHGSGWSEFLPDATFVRGPVPNDQLGGIYRSAGVVLNDHWEDMGVSGFVSNRLFDAVAAGARVVSDPVEGVEDLFRDAVQVYRSVDELRDLAGPQRHTRFPSDSSRRAIAADVARLHSFDARARELLDVVVEL